jgi:hypothetical protein
MDLYSYDDSSTWMKGKVPDKTLEVDFDGADQSPNPTIVAEVGYDEPYQTVLEDVKAWLLGSLCYVRCAILVYLEKPASLVDFGDITKWTGFVEVWHRVK